MKPKGLNIDKDSPDFKKMLKLSADTDLLANVKKEKPKFFAYLKNKLAPIQEEKPNKSEHKCQQFEKISLITTTKTTTQSEDTKQDVSQKNMPTQLPSTNLNNIESSSAQANKNLQSISKWNTTPEHIQQVTNNIEKQQFVEKVQKIETNDQGTSKSVTRHHLPPVTRKTTLGPVSQVRSNHSHHYTKFNESESNINYKAIYQPIPNPMATYNSNDKEWVVAKQRIQRPKDHDILTIDSIFNNQQQKNLSTRELTNTEIKRNEFIERKIAQEQYRQELQQQIMQQKPVKPIIPRTTLRFDGETEFKTETRQNYKPFRFVTALNDVDERSTNGNQRVKKKFIEKECHQPQNIVNKHNEKHSAYYNQDNKVQSNQISSEFEGYQQDTSGTRRNSNEISFKNHPQQQNQQNNYYQQSIKVDENNNAIEQQSNVQYKDDLPKNEMFCCNYCKKHYLNDINDPSNAVINQNQINLNPLVGVRTYKENKQINDNVLNEQVANEKSKFKKQQSQPIICSKSTHSIQETEESIPRIYHMMIPGKPKPHKNQSHLKFEGKNCFITTNNLMYKDHSMQNLSPSRDNEDYHSNREVFIQQVMSSNGNKKSITGNVRGKVKNKYRDLFASSEDIFGAHQDNKLQYSIPSNHLSVKYKSTANLPLILATDQQSDKNRNNHQSEDNRQKNYQTYNDCFNNGINDFQINQQIEDENQCDDDQCDEDYYDEETDNQVEEVKQKKPIFVPKEKSSPNTTLKNTDFEHRKDLNTTNSNYGSMLQCPTLNLVSDSNKYEYRYTIGNHKYFTKKSSIS